MKFVQLLMVCAIFNPFCCCTAGLLTADEVNPTSDAHSCCSGSQETPTAPDSKHDPESCPHKALKEYQATALNDTSITSDNAYSLPVLLAVIDYLVFEPVPQLRQPVSLATASHAPPQPLSQCTVSIGSD